MRTVITRLEKAAMVATVHTKNSFPNVLSYVLTRKLRTEAMHFSTLDSCRNLGIYAIVHCSLPRSSARSRHFDDIMQI